MLAVSSATLAGTLLSIDPALQHVLLFIAVGAAGLALAHWLRGDDDDGGMDDL